VRRRNRKRKKLNSRIFPVPFAGLLVVGVTLALGYVWLCLRCQTLGDELKKLEERREILAREHQQELFKWTRAKAPHQLELALAKHKLAMTWPSSRQVVQLRADDLVADRWHDGTQLARMERGRQDE